MHDTAYITGKKFFDTYVTKSSSVLEVGSQNVNGSLRDHAPNSENYIGIDLCSGKGVDIVLKDPYKYPFGDNHFDVVVTSTCFEHSEMFWLSFLESMRVLKPSGVFYCNAPSSRMSYHRYPVDCWRFMPDAGKGLETWAKYNNISAKVLESFIVAPEVGLFDWCCIFIKDEQYMSNYPTRVIDSIKLPIINGFKFLDKDDSNWNRIINHNKKV